MVVNVVGNVAMNVVGNVAMNVVTVVNVADQYWFIQRLSFNACRSTLVVQRLLFNALSAPTTHFSISKRA